MQELCIFALQTVLQGAVFSGFAVLAGLGIVRYYFNEKDRFTEAWIAKGTFDDAALMDGSDKTGNE